MQKEKRVKIAVIIGIVLLVGAGIWAIFLAVRSSGSAEVQINAIPDDSQITLDGKPIKSGKHHLKSGTYQLKATRSGFMEDTQTLDVGKDDLSITLVPQIAEDPSPEAIEWLKNNDAEGHRREAIIGQRLQDEGQTLRNDNPFVSELPIPYNQQRYAIDYIEEPSSKTGIIIQIIADDAQAREYALDEIRELGYDPSDMEIQFLEYTNPLGNGAQ